ncbi:MAG: YjjW family glycine radical enzyme activase [Romboutsia sp.]|uniref:YjjW family glycine radical enzyme activase n=1 Tax=Romboutsia sp. TaxID=1965302 RepID=UPI003F388569
MKAPINKIIDMSFIDGPGCRISVFLQGCNMKCIYCHNPETQNICTSCRKCIDVCKSKAITFDEKITYNKDKCTNCDECINICNNYSSPKITYYTPKELFDYINKYKNFIDGVTFSGGECTLYSDFIVEFTKIIHEKTSLTVFVDTNGYIEKKSIDKLIYHVDGFMFDLKAFENDTHKKVTDVENHILFENMKMCSSVNKLYEIRTVLLEDINDDEIIFNRQLEFIKNLNEYTKFKLIPFRNYGVKGYLSKFNNYPDDKYIKYYDIAKSILKYRMHSSMI